ncbi:PaaI family thioesterase [Acinetobacter pittii]|uniref:PaaI family thioesterase n=1 Tax=Acinetobacter pittii TaxID=48296 RepID=UPI00301E5035
MHGVAFQDLYPDEYSHCFGCGRNNKHGHHLKSFWGDNMNTSIAKITPSNIYTGGVPDHLYGGLIASLLDCHGAASAAAFKSLSLGNKFDGSEPLARFVTGTLAINFKKPTPTECELTLTAKLISIDNRKVNVELTLAADDMICATGEMLAIQLKEN